MGSADIKQKQGHVPQLAGPFSVELLGSNIVDGIILYSLQVSGMDGAHTVYRRYSSFAQLRNCLQSDAKFQQLPPMPPKSVVRTRVSKSFNEHRKRQLSELISVATACDPYADCPLLCKFLGIVVASPPAMANEAMELLVLHTIFESDEEHV